jgi:HEXXH motif-containing protein
MTATAPVQGLTLTDGDLVAFADSSEAQRLPLGKLISGQLGKHKLLISAVVRFGAAAVPAAGASLHQHYSVLAAIERTAPGAAATIIGQPHVGAWAARCLRELSNQPGLAEPDLGHLGAIAVSAAILAEYPCRVILRVRNGKVMLPGFGQARVCGDCATITVSEKGQAVIESGGQATALTDPCADGSGWQALRLLTLGDRPLLLDDLDQNRSYDPYPLPGRLSQPEVARWQDGLDEAWRLLSAHHPGYAAALRLGLKSLVPISQRTDDRNVSATSGDAFGAVAASMPSDGVALAVALIHEFQHTKLCAIGDIEPLVERRDGPLFYAPWRPDPRPAGALLHGIFAHMAVADFWRIHRGVAAPREQLLANVEFARWLRQTRHAVGLLAENDALTRAGRLLLARVTTHLDGWVAEQVPPLALRLAAEAAADHLSGWRLRNLAPDSGDIDRLARDWLCGRPARGIVRTRLLDPPRAASGSARMDLLYARLRDHARFETDCSGWPDAPDVAWARGDRELAARGYLAELGADPARLAAWSGLGLTAGQYSSLHRSPDVAYALHHRLAELTQPPVGPLHLAGWLSGVSVRDLDVQV